MEATHDDKNNFINITDDGAGIDPENIENIFIPFFTTKDSGSGIGLSLSREIMRLHGGTISVNSNLGKGTFVNLIFNRRER